MTLGTCGAEFLLSLKPVAVSTPRLLLEETVFLLFFPSLLELCPCFLSVSGEVLGLMRTLSMENKTCLGDFGLLGPRMLLRREMSEREDERRLRRESGRGAEEEIGGFCEGELRGEKIVAGRVAEE